MKQLFVSYAREDRLRVEPIVECLRNAGFEVFWDQSMPAGVDWAEFLEAQLSSAHRLVVLWTALSVSSRWVRTEATEAMQQNKLLPVLLDDVRPPLAFRQIHCFDLIGWQGDCDDPRLARLVVELRVPGPGGSAEDGAKTPSAESGRTPPPPPPPTWARPVLIVAAAMALLSLAFEGWQRVSAPVESHSPSAGAASVPAGPAPTASEAAPVQPPHAASGPAPSATARRCAGIQDQVALGNPISASDRAFLKAGCR